MHEHTHGQEHAGHVDTSAIRRSFRDFIPLVVIFGVIALFTIMQSMRAGAWETAYLMRNFMGAFFIVFGGFKIIRWKGFVDAYQIYDIVAKRSRVYGYTYPIIELGLGFSYLFSFQLALVQVITIAIMCIGAIGVGQELVKKNTIPCACLGVVFKIPMTKVTFFEDILMAAMAAGMFFV
ncbi:MAG: hypothetical protein COU47_03350 [Candidatus Niyogibacteria bacterium CG10_big_fil_rev_8_21_14_0_10_46_36]|uniref:Methylamine utilisation protein MauE domain-containing protein n=1 Tax=Candidatus Niyogibacteria bacterium CG10_big_fil_rev_8_21_14_0_10_46_36 TaxID=1974726 RepID=A0A2H0TCU2_9BACT|nr:MAG: hypothetical protein COU47_03350 [Candidatus Niyogibacteria bacterium CG10_big_fil_rev_8_21_14_0_10_46_36]